MTRQILIVEDEQLLLRTLTRTLSAGTSYEVSGADCLKQARDTLERLRPDLVICDLSLTDGVGVEVLDLLRRHGLSIPVIVLSGMVDAYADVLPDSPRVIVRRKPFPANDLLHLVESQLSLSASTGGTVFSVSDYLQMAHFSQRSIRIDLRYRRGAAGSVLVWKGEPWSARVEAKRGMEAIAEVLDRVPVAIATAPLSTPPDCDRELVISMQGLLLELARQRDEGTLASYQEPEDAGTTTERAPALRAVEAICAGALSEASEQLRVARVCAPTDSRLSAWWCDVLLQRWTMAQTQSGGAA